MSPLCQSHAVLCPKWGEGPSLGGPAQPRRPGWDQMPFQVQAAPCTKRPPAGQSLNQGRGPGDPRDTVLPAP